MKKIALFILAISLGSGSLYAQPEDEKKTEEDVEIVIKDGKVTIEAENLDDLSMVDLNTIIRVVTEGAQNIQETQVELLKEVDEKLASGAITEEQAEEMREMINERSEESMEMLEDLMEAWEESYEERIEAWEEDYEAKMEAWEQEVEEGFEKEGSAYQMPPVPPVPPLPPGTKESKGQKIIINEDGITILKGDDEEALDFRFDGEEEYDDDDDDNYDNIDRTEGYGSINFGFNQQFKDGSLINTGAEELNFWNSTEFNFGFGGKTRIGSPYSKFYVQYGAEFSWHRFRLTGQNILQYNSDSSVAIGGYSDTANPRAIEKSNYHIAYFNVPIMFQLDFSDVGDMDDAFTIGVGGYAGVRLGAKRKLEYKAAQADFVEEKTYDDFYTEQFRYGLMAQVGWSSFKITAKYDLNNYFKENQGPEYNMASITLGFTF